ncbi:MAG TPA: DsbA family protein [Gemmatimonadaceae bacterium]
MAARTTAKRREPAADLRELIAERDHAVGPANAPVTVVEYGDFECPHCGRAYPLLRTLREQFGDRLRVVFRHYPVPAVHPNAELAARAAEAAALQGKFWPMHDRLFEQQASLSPELIEREASALALDMQAFREALESHEVAKRVAQDIASGEMSGVHWTPTFFVNGHRAGYAEDLDSLRRAVEGALAAR